jgi:energy-coupling factor transporter ATP-binding protein EcfA2
MAAVSSFESKDLQRINVVGTSSSGKSTLSTKLADLLGVPYIEMDLLYHEPNWTEPTPEVFRTRLEKAIAKPRWVLDGNYHSKTFDIKWARSSMIVWLDVPFGKNMYRAFRRAIQRSWTKQELWPGTGNCETFGRTFFSKESMILWTAKSFARLKRRYAAIELSPPEGVKFVRLSTSDDIEEFYEAVHAVKNA